MHQNQSEFIALQALEYENQFYLWMRSGFIGSPGKTSLTGPYESKDKIIVEFGMVFSSKTCCTWEERHSLRYQEGRFVQFRAGMELGNKDNWQSVDEVFTHSIDCVVMMHACVQLHVDRVGLLDGDALLRRLERVFRQRRERWRRCRQRGLAQIQATKKKRQSDVVVESACQCDAGMVAAC